MIEVKVPVDTVTIVMTKEDAKALEKELEKILGHYLMFECPFPKAAELYQMLPGD